VPRLRCVQPCTGRAGGNTAGRARRAAHHWGGLPRRELPRCTRPPPQGQCRRPAARRFRRGGLQTERMNRRDFPRRGWSSEINRISAQAGALGSPHNGDGYCQRRPRPGVREGARPRGWFEPTPRRHILSRSVGGHDRSTACTPGSLGRTKAAFSRRADVRQAARGRDRPPVCSSRTVRLLPSLPSRSPLTSYRPQGPTSEQ